MATSAWLLMQDNAGRLMCSCRLISAASTQPILQNECNHWLASVQWIASSSPYVRLPPQVAWWHVDHPTARDCRRGRLGQVPHLEQDAHGASIKLEALSIGQAQQAVVVQHLQGKAPLEACCSNRQGSALHPIARESRWAAVTPTTLWLSHHPCQTWCEAPQVTLA